MRRLFWLALGVTVGVMVMRKLSRAAERMTPSGLGRSVSTGLQDLAGALREFSADVRDAMREQEAVLRAGAGFDGTLGATVDGTVGGTFGGTPAAQPRPLRGETESA